MITKYRTEVEDTNRTIVVREKGFKYESFNYDNPKKIADMMNELFNIDRLAEEYCYLVCMTNRCRIIGIFEISHGSADATLVSMRDVFMKALMVGASQIAIVHNHPSGEVSPSADDIKTCDRVKEASKMLNIRLADFIIVGRNKHKSFREVGLIE